MTEHVCKWGIYASEDDGNVYVICQDPTCCHDMTVDEAEARLNATERLSAEDARWVVEVLRYTTNEHGVDIGYNRNPYYLADVFEAYADTLEGKCTT